MMHSGLRSLNELPYFTGTWDFPHTSVAGRNVALSRASCLLCMTPTAQGIQGGARVPPSTIEVPCGMQEVHMSYSLNSFKWVIYGIV